MVTIPILFQISTVTFQTKLLILFFFFGRNRSASWASNNTIIYLFYFFIETGQLPRLQTISSNFFFFLRNRPACLGFKQYFYFIIFFLFFFYRNQPAWALLREPQWASNETRGAMSAGM